MKRSSIIVFVAIVGTGSLHADTWSLPKKKGYLSENGKFRAHVTPAGREAKAKLEMFRIEEDRRELLWQCALGNEGAPMNVFVSDDGQHVATVNEWSARVHGGMGDYVVAFYHKAGLIMHYSLEQILHYPDQIDLKEFRRLSMRSVSGRFWACRPMFFDEHDGRLRFCVWLHFGKRWLAWDVTDGTEVHVDEGMVHRWNEKGLCWARGTGIESREWDRALEFLGVLRRAEDRKTVESFLRHSGFRTYPKIKMYPRKKPEFLRFQSGSFARARAEHILAEWDGRPTGKAYGLGQRYYYLGVVEGSIELPCPPRADDSWLCIYFIPGAGAEADWYAEAPVHRVIAHFTKYYVRRCNWPGGKMRFRLEGVTPGTYWIKAVWDKAEPHTFADYSTKGPPSPGDYESTQAQTITVQAGQTIKGIVIDCTNEVTDGAD